MSDRVLAARFLAYGAVLAAGLTASVTSREWWTLGLPFIGIVFVEALVYAATVFDFLKGKTREHVIEQAAKRAVELIVTEQRHRETLELIAAMRGRLPDYMVDAAGSGRLRITVEEPDE